MSNCVFGFPDFTQATPTYTPVVSGAVGSWSSALPIGNVINPRLSRIARSNDAADASTVFDIDLGRACPIGLLAILVSNRSTAAQIGWKLGSSAGTSDVLQALGNTMWPSGVTVDDVTGPDGTLQNIWHVYLPAGSPLSARYVRVEIHDHLNGDGRLDVARVIVAGAYRPSVCMQTGAKSEIEDDTVSSPTDGGAMLYQAKAQRRTDAFTLPNVGRVEALESIRKMQHRLGKSGQVFFVWDESDPYKYERSYLATLRQLGALDYGFSALYSSVAFEVAEEL